MNSRYTVIGLAITTFVGYMFSDSWVGAVVLALASVVGLSTLRQLQLHHDEITKKLISERDELKAENKELKVTNEYNQNINAAGVVAQQGKGNTQQTKPGD